MTYEPSKIDGVTMDIGSLDPGPTRCPEPFRKGRVVHQPSDGRPERGGVSRFYVQTGPLMLDDIALTRRSRTNHGFPHRHRLENGCDTSLKHHWIQWNEIGRAHV